MSTIRLKVSVDPVKISVNKDDYADEWQEHQLSAGVDEDDIGEPPDEFVIERVQEEFENGVRDLSEAFESAIVDVQKAS